MHVSALSVQAVICRFDRPPPPFLFNFFYYGSQKPVFTLVLLGFSNDFATDTISDHMVKVFMYSRTI